MLTITENNIAPVNVFATTVNAANKKKKENKAKNGVYRRGTKEILSEITSGV